MSPLGFPADNPAEGISPATTGGGPRRWPLCCPGCLIISGGMVCVCLWPGWRRSSGSGPGLHINRHNGSGVGCPAHSHRPRRQGRRKVFKKCIFKFCVFLLLHDLGWSLSCCACFISCEVKSVWRVPPFCFPGFKSGQARLGRRLGEPEGGGGNWS